MPLIRRMPSIRLVPADHYVAAGAPANRVAISTAQARIVANMQFRSAWRSPLTWTDSLAGTRRPCENCLMHMIIPEMHARRNQPLRRQSQNRIEPPLSQGLGSFLSIQGPFDLRQSCEATVLPDRPGVGYTTRTDENVWSGLARATTSTARPGWSLNEKGIRL
jgi:hypothetical protein